VCEMKVTQTWHAPSLQSPAAAREVFEEIGRAVPISLISTFRPHLMTVRPDEILRDVLERSELRQYDFLPVEARGAVRGLLCAEDLRRSGAMARSDVRVRDKALKLEDVALISADAPMLEFIRSAHTYRCRLVLRGTKIDGIVTFSDLQQLPVRALLFMLITHMELLIAEVIRCVSQVPDEWTMYLAKQRQERIETRWRRLESDNMAIDRLTATEFGDKISILSKWLGRLPARLPASPSLLATLREAERLRHVVAHSGDYAKDRKNAQQTSRRVEESLSAVGWLTDVWQVVR
jgi:CBS domain-containing protein